MEISLKIHANCSEWDQEVFSDLYIADTSLKWDADIERVVAAAKKVEWDK